MSRLVENRDLHGLNFPPRLSRISRMQSAAGAVSDLTSPYSLAAGILSPHTDFLITGLSALQSPIDIKKKGKKTNIPLRFFFFK